MTQKVLEMAAFPPLSTSSSLPPPVLAQSQGEQINLAAAVRRDGGFHSEWSCETKNPTV